MSIDFLGGYTIINMQYEKRNIRIANTHDLESEVRKNAEKT